MTNKTRPKPAVDLLWDSSRIIYNNLPVYFLLLVVPLLLTMMTDPMPELSKTPSFKEMYDAMIATLNPLVIAGVGLSAAFFAPLSFTELKTAAGKNFSIKQSLGGYKYFWRLLGLAVVSGALIVLGFMALIIPGLIMVRRYVLAPYFLMDKNLSITEAMRASAKASKPVSWSIYGILGVALLFTLLSGFGAIGLIAGTILQVLYSAAFALRYHEIK